MGTLKGLIRRAFLICSEKEGLDRELKHLKFVFTKINGYPSKVFYRSLKRVENAINREKELEVRNADSAIDGAAEQGVEQVIFPYMCLPYKGKKGEKILNGLTNHLSKILPKNVKPRLTFKGNKLGSFFKIKDNVKREHQTSLVYGYQDNENKHEREKFRYMGETNVRFETRMDEHLCKDSAVFRHLNKDKVVATHDNFKIMETGYQGFKDRKIAESLYIKEYKPDLNGQKVSYKLKLFN